MQKGKRVLGKTKKENEVSREVHDNELQYWP